MAGSICGDIEQFAGGKVPCRELAKVGGDEFGGNYELLTEVNPSRIAYLISSASVETFSLAIR